MANAGFWKTGWFVGTTAVICAVLRLRANDFIPGLVAILDKVQAEYADRRHQAGAERALALRAVLGGGVIAKPVSRVRAAWI